MVNPFNRFFTKQPIIDHRPVAPKESAYWNKCIEHMEAARTEEIKHERRIMIIDTLTIGLAIAIFILVCIQVFKQLRNGTR